MKQNQFQNYSDSLSERSRTIKLAKGEKMMAVNFMPIDQSFIRPIWCKNTETLASLEQKIYDEYPKFKELNTYITVGGEIKKRFKTLLENRIQDGNAIIINIYDN